MAVKFYAVANGKQGSGIYTDWATTEANVTGVSGVKYKAFPSRAAACVFLQEKGVKADNIKDFAAGSPNLKNGVEVEAEPISPPKTTVKPTTSPKKKALVPASADLKAAHREAEPGTMYAYVDGSFRQGYAVYGYGVVIVANGCVVETMSGYGARPEYVTMRNVAGEVLGAVKAMEYALAEGAQKLVLYFDYQGIESWATGAWKRNNDLTRGYFEFVRDIRGKLSLSFQKVKGHSGDRFNDLADELAKQAVLSSDRSEP